ncbi:MAG: DUF6128 domain-containing protein [Lachnospiraceae bacterium]
MSNYRRLISYIYEYEGKTKGRNVGFAKLEARSGQCKINVNVKRIFTNGDAGVYLLSSIGEIPLGKLFLRGGNGEFRAAVQVENVEGSGCGMDDCYGLAIHEPKDDWRTYRTIWEDEVTFAAEIELSKAVPKNEPTVLENAKKAVAEIEEELAREEGAEIKPLLKDERLTEQEPPAEPNQPAEIEPPAQPSPPAEIEPTTEPNQPAEIEPPAQPSPPAEIEPPAEMTPPELAGLTAASEQTDKSAFGNERQESNEIASGTALPAAQTVSTGEGEWTGIGISQKKQQQSYIPQAGNPEDLEKLCLIEEPEEKPEQIWARFEKAYPKIQAFDSEHGCVILAIKPQDIGLLPREIWVYGNNSFLLHGYYNYRYLILARLENPRGTPRYLLGVPGHYYSNEKYMASMFGFPHFVLSKKQPSGDGRFGYWYTDIRFS